MADRREQDQGNPGIDRSRKGGHEDKMPERMPGTKERERTPEHESGGGYRPNRGPNP